ncbi:ABC transporter substrate-binding protein [Dongshaea marina]|uniref:ABC transporter substrate-binding protein n=1 Tax=Dongshaea marina TaxID=2047966 RepID=UPI000D3E5CA4|nr:ABC transporter substrate-binding protein [Dongshaea marina]
MWFRTHLIGIALLLMPAAAHSQPIRLILNDWPSQLVISQITAQLLQKQGYQTRFIQAPTLKNRANDQQWGLLKYDGADLQMELWESSMGDKYRKLLQNGMIQCLGDYQARSREDWWYPIHVEKLCPGLPDWRALRDCWKIFVQPDTAPLGRYLAGHWEQQDMARIRALKMKFKVVRVDEDILWQTLKHAVAKKQAIVLYNWTPNWTSAAYPGKFIEFPPWHPECKTDPNRGINPEVTHDCGEVSQGWIKKVANARLTQRAPCAIELLQKIDFTSEQIAQMSRRVVLDKLDVQESANLWLREHAALWKHWLATSCSPSQIKRQPEPSSPGNGSSLSPGDSRRSM